MSARVVFELQIPETLETESVIGGGGCILLQGLISHSSSACVPSL